jgi:hypothetical protein
MVLLRGVSTEESTKKVPQATGSAHFSRQLNLEKAVFGIEMNLFASVQVLNIELISVKNQSVALLRRRKVDPNSLVSNSVGLILI